ncbi:MAG: AMP-binding protein [bacterium]
MAVPEKIANAVSLNEAIRIACVEFKELDAQKYKDDSKEPGEFKHKRSFEHFYKDISALACAICNLGVPEGSMISILSENRPEWNITDFAIHKNACATVGVYTNDSVDHIKFKMIDTQSVILFVEDKKQLGKVISIPPDEIPSVKHIVVYDPAGVNLENDKRLIAYGYLMECGCGCVENINNEVERRSKGNTLKTLARLVYTSGTSGNPKGAMLTHGNLLSNTIGATEYINMQPHDSLISYLPEAHVLQTILTLCALLSGSTIGYSFRKTLAQDLVDLRPTLFPGVQRVWAKMQQNIEKRIAHGLPNLVGQVLPEQLSKIVKNKAGIDKVRYFISGAGKLEPYTYLFYQEKLGITIHLGYGLSETSPVISVNGHDQNKFGSSGKPIPGVEVKIVDSDRKEVSVGTVGELAARGPNIFVGYYNQEKKYRSVVDDDGWFYTGDRGYLDPEGFVFVLGRAGNRVKFSDGEHHDIEEIASKFQEFTKLLQQVAVYGEGKDYPVAIVSLTDEEDDLRSAAELHGITYTNRNEFAYNEKIIGICRAEFEQARRNYLQKFKVPDAEDIKKVLYIRPMSEDNGEKTPTQKTRLNFIHEKYNEQLDELYNGDESFAVLKVD